MVYNKSRITSILTSLITKLFCDSLWICRDLN